MTVKIDGSTGVDTVQPGSVDKEDLKWVPPFTKEYVSSAQVITLAGQLTLTHGFGSVPKMTEMELVCVTADAGCAVGDIIPLTGFFYTTNVTNYSGVQVTKNATNLLVRFGASNLAVMNASGVINIITPANWRIVVRAWA